jgi:hypothetical protein
MWCERTLRKACATSLITTHRGLSKSTCSRSRVLAYVDTKVAVRGRYVADGSGSYGRSLPIL